MSNVPPSPLSRKSVDFRVLKPTGDRQALQLPPIELEVVILGAPKVGKTAIAEQFLWRRFNEEYRETVEDFNWIEYECGPRLEQINEGTLQHIPNNKRAEQSCNQNLTPVMPRTFMLKLIDTSGSNEFLAMRDLNIQKGHAFILVHSPDVQDSFEEVTRLRSHIARTNAKHAPVIVVTNKVDLAEKASDHDMKALEFKARLNALRPEVERFAALDNCSSMEVSAKDFDSVERIFHELLHTSPYASALHRELKKRRQSMPADLLDRQKIMEPAVKSGKTHQSYCSSEEHSKNGCVVS